MALSATQKKKIEEEEKYRAHVRSKHTSTDGGLNKIAAGLLGIFLGGIGLHKFYLGRIGWGIVYLLFAWTGIPAIVGFIEGIIYLTMADTDFRRKYVGDGGSGAVRAIVGFIVGIFGLGALGVFAAVLLVAINPAGQLEKAFNAKRLSDVNAILRAIEMYKVDHNGALPLGVDTNEREISSSDADICSELVPGYMAALPVDPSLEHTSTGYADCPVSGYSTHYTVKLDENGTSVTVSAPDAEGKSVVVSR